MIITAIFIGVAIRIAFIFRAAGSGVDDYYWQQVAKGFRQSRQLPLVLPGKYLMEDERQFYPPLYGLLLSFLPSRLWRWGGFTALLLELGTVGILIGWLVASGLGNEISLTIVILGYLLAPVLASYNSQLNSRLLGQLFLLTWVLALQPETLGINNLVGIGIASFAFAMILLSHKMTLQLAVILIIPLCFTGGYIIPAITAIAGVALAILMVGPKFLIGQIKGHCDILKFWNAHWPFLGCHPLNHSPIYGNPDERYNQTFHGQGVNGVTRHLRNVVSYVPAVWPLAIIVPLGYSEVPTWVLTWLVVTYLWALGTLFIPALKCLGGGHLYLYNAVPPTVLLWAYLYESGGQSVEIGLYTALAVILLVLMFAWQVVGNRPRTIDDDLGVLFEKLKDKPKMNVAVLPTQVAEPVACLTKHAVLWGAHGSGFSNLEGWFPVLKIKLSKIFAKWKIDAVLWDAQWAPSLEEILHQESLIDGEVQHQGRWRFARCSTGRISQ